ncbi:MAG: hypothetical protein WCP29_05220 [Acidobacteriota bacterium]
MQARTRQASLFAAVALGLVVVLAGAALAQTNNPRIGSWKLNLAKSTYTGGEAPKNSTFTIVAAGAGVKVTVDGVNADGSVSHWIYTTNYDGKDSPVTGSPNRDVVAATRVGSNTVNSVYKKDGKVTVTQTSVLSGDGKAITITGKSTDAKGKSVDFVEVYERQ